MVYDNDKSGNCEVEHGSAPSLFFILALAFDAVFRSGNDLEPFFRDQAAAFLALPVRPPFHPLQRLIERFEVVTLLAGIVEDLFLLHVVGTEIREMIGVGLLGTFSVLGRCVDRLFDPSQLAQDAFTFFEKLFQVVLELLLRVLRLFFLES